MAYARKMLYDTHSVTTPPPASRPEVVAEETDFVIILAALLCALICVVGLLAVARCAWLRRGISGSGIANKGLKKKVVNSLPKYTYSSGIDKAQLSTVEDCVICLAEYVDGDEVRVLPQCGHRFHVGCIDTWLGSHSSCPSCRQILVLTRCRKCGEFPAAGAGAVHTSFKPAQPASSSTSPPPFLP